MEADSFLGGLDYKIMNNPTEMAILAYWDIRGLAAPIRYVLTKYIIVRAAWHRPSVSGNIIVAIF